MPNTWCANTNSHPKKTKIGCKPSHPKGQRRIGRELADFLGQKFSVSFDEHDYLCSPCYLSAQRECNHVSLNSASDSMDTDGFRSTHASATSAVSSMSPLADTDSSNPGSDGSSSTASEKDMANVISFVEQKEATTLLNAVLAVLGQGPIIDVRNRNIVRQQVNGALAMIRKAAESILREDEDEELFVKSNSASDVTIDEIDELVTNFKYLVTTSDYSEQIRLLTLAPKAWGRIKMQNFFQCSQHQVRYAVFLRDTDRVLSLPIDLRGNQSFDALAEKEIFDFYHTDEISRV
jgi:hypothetical protein